MFIANDLIAYAVYFDYKRRNDAEFRRAIKRESRRQARAAKEEKEAAGKEQEVAIKQAVDDALAAGFPSSLEEKEAYFMEEVAQGEGMASDGMSLDIRIMTVLLLTISQVPTLSVPPCVSTRP